MIKCWIVMRRVAHHAVRHWHRPVGRVVRHAAIHAVTIPTLVCVVTGDSWVPPPLFPTYGSHGGEASSTGGESYGPIGNGFSLGGFSGAGSFHPAASVPTFLALFPNNSSEFSGDSSAGSIVLPNGNRLVVSVPLNEEQEVEIPIPRLLEFPHETPGGTPTLFGIVPEDHPTPETIPEPGTAWIMAAALTLFMIGWRNNGSTRST